MDKYKIAVLFCSIFLRQWNQNDFLSIHYYNPIVHHFSFLRSCGCCYCSLKLAAALSALDFCSLISFFWAARTLSLFKREQSKNKKCSFCKGFFHLKYDFFLRRATEIFFSFYWLCTHFFLLWNPWDLVINCDFSLLMHFSHMSK